MPTIVHPPFLPYSPRDFIETPEGLLFAVVDPRPEAGRVLACLRYARVGTALRKLATLEADAYLALRAPAYRFVSERLEAAVHGVPIARIRRHYRPRERVSALLAAAARDALEHKAARLVEILARQGLPLASMGLTGSLLIGAHTPRSDLDLVIYGRERFFAARAIVRRAIGAGTLAELDEAAWRDSYERRGCALSFAEYLWHERRKFDKGLIEGTKFDLTLVDETLPADPGPVRKLGPARLLAEVEDASQAFDYPARYRLAHPEIGEVLSFTQTYAGQAEAGEWVEIAGILEETAAGRRRLVVGTSREAPGEYIKVTGGRS